LSKTLVLFEFGLLIRKEGIKVQHTQKTTAQTKRFFPSFSCSEECRRQDERQSFCIPQANYFYYYYKKVDDKKSEEVLNFSSSFIILLPTILNSCITKLTDNMHYSL
jgi:hypothetical protein